MRLWRVETCSYAAYREVTLILHTAGGAVRCANDGHGLNGHSHTAAPTAVPVHNPITWDLSGEVESCTVHLPPERFDNLIDDAGSSSLMRAFDFQFATRATFVNATGQPLIDELRRSSPLGASYAETFADATGARLMRRHAHRGVPARTGPQLSKIAQRRVIAYIDASLNTSLTTEEPARVAGLSRSHINRCLVAAMGMPPYRCVQQQRLERARNLLA